MNHPRSPSQHLALLESARLIRRLEAESNLEYFFRHALIQEATYASLLKSDRRAIHRQVAETLEEVYAENPEEGYGLLAYHYQQAEMSDKARAYLFKAGEQARARYANQDAIRFYTEALTLIPESESEMRYAIVQARERVYDVLGERAAQWQDLETLVAVLETLPADPGRRAALLLRQGDYADKTGAYAEARRLARQALALAQISEQAELESRSYFQWGVSLWRATEYTAARSPLEQARTIAHTRQLLALEADSVRMLGVLDDSQSDYASARVHFKEALRLKRAIGDRRGEGQALNSLGIVAFHQNDYPEAQTVFEESLRLKQMLGDRVGEMSTLHNLSNVLVHVGRLTEAKAYYLLAAEVSHEIHDPDGEASALLGLAQVWATLGQYDQARTFYNSAIAQFQEVGDREGEADALTGLGALAHSMQDFELALTLAHQAQAIAQELSNEYIQGYALTISGHAWLGLGHPSEAVSAYTRALQLRRTMGQQTLAIESVAGLAQACLAQGHLSEALTWVDEILAHLATRSLTGVEDPTHVYLTAYHVLHTAHDLRAEQVLASGHAALLEQATHISDDAMRRSFLENVPSHRELLKLTMPR